MDSFRSSSLQNERHFFKMIRSGNCNELMIPPEFARKCGKSLPDRVYLETPGGVIFPVDLERRRNEVWLQKGWLEFAKFHSLCHGYLLLFQYQESSNKFVVLICDESGSEIEYPSSISVRPSQKTKPSFREAMHYGESSKMKLKTKVDCSHASEQQDTNPKFSADVKKAVALAKAFRSKNPNFMVIIHPCNAVSRTLSLRMDFVEEHITTSRDQVILQVGGKSWEVTCILYLRSARFVTGWNIFARDNNLSAGDVCVFELINRRVKLIKVVIFRGT